LAITNELESHTKGYHEKKNAAKEAASAVNETLDLTEIESSIEHVIKGIVLNPLHLEEPEPTNRVTLKKRFQLPWKKSNRLIVTSSEDKKYNSIKKGFLLAVAYSATIGGLSSLVGTAPNIFVKGFADSQYKNTAFRINFLNFLLFALPVALLMLVICWLWLQIYFNTKEFKEIEYKFLIFLIWFFLHRFFQFRTDPESQAIQADLKLMLLKQYHDLGRP
ncbi:unnamed protein product, partial [Adineta steineri]